MALKINSSKLLADYEQAKQDLALSREIYDAEVRDRIRPYLDKGILGEGDVDAIVNKLCAGEQEAFDRKWATVEAYIEDAPGVPADESVADCANLAQQEATPGIGVGYQIN